MLITAADAHTYAFVISVATAGKYVRLKSVQVHKEFHKPTRLDHNTLLQCIKRNLIACTMVLLSRISINYLKISCQLPVTGTQPFEPLQTE